MSDKNYISEWDMAWSDKDSLAWYPDEQVIRFLARYVAKKIGIKNDEIKYWGNQKPIGLDLGCGTGRNLLPMCELGIDTFGFDLSSVAINFLANWLNTKGLKANLSYGDISTLPYPNDFFDFVVCHGVLDHMTKQTREKGLIEINRILKPGGFFFFSVISKSDSAFGFGDFLEDDTWVINEGFESNIPQAFFDINRVNDEFSNFNLINITQITQENLKGRSLIGSDKNYEKDDRFYIVASRPSQ